MMDPSTTAPVSKKICFYSIATHLGGAEKSLLDLVSYLGERSQGAYQPWVLLPKATGPLIEILREKGIPTTVLPMPNRFLSLSREAPYRSVLLGIFIAPQLCIYAYRFCRILNAEKVSLLHSTGLKCHFVAALLKPFHQKKIIWHLRDILKTDGLGAFLNFLRKATGTFVISNSYATQKSLVLNDAPEKGSARVIYNGIEPRVFFPHRQDHFRKLFGVESTVPIIGIMGVLARWKGQVEFIRMARMLLSMGIDARFVIIGDQIYDTVADPDFRKVLDQEVAKLELNKFFHFAQFQEDAARAINGLDVLVHASIRPEPFGRVILESMACGVPVVASAAGGVLELLEGQKTGCLFPPGDVLEMAKAVKSILVEADLREVLIKNSRAVFLEKFTVQSCVDQIIEVYRRLWV